MSAPPLSLVPIKDIKLIPFSFFAGLKIFPSVGMFAMFPFEIIALISKRVLRGVI